jgi:hypothetical protein
VLQQRFRNLDVIEFRGKMKRSATVLSIYVVNQVLDVILFQQQS